MRGSPIPKPARCWWDPNDFFVQDIALVSSFFSEYLKKGSYSFDNDNSYFGRVEEFPAQYRDRRSAALCDRLTPKRHPHPSGYAEFPAHLPLQPVQSARVGFSPALGRRPGGALHHLAPGLHLGAQGRSIRALHQSLAPRESRAQVRPLAAQKADCILAGKHDSTGVPGRSAGGDSGVEQGI